MTDNCEILGCPNKRRTQKYGKVLCKYHLRLIDSVKKKGVPGDTDEVEDWDNCEWCMSQVPRTITHHYTYEPESLIELCDRCHQVVHQSDEHILQPSEYQLWQADLKLRVEDLKKIRKCGRVRIEGLGVGTVSEDYGSGFKFSFCSEEDSSVLTDRRYHSRTDVEFLEQKPWNLEDEVI